MSTPIYLFPWSEEATPPYVIKKIARVNPIESKANALILKPSISSHNKKSYPINNIIIPMQGMFKVTIYVLALKQIKKSYNDVQHIGIRNVKHY